MSAARLSSCLLRNQTSLLNITCRAKSSPPSAVEAPRTKSNLPNAVEAPRTIVGNDVDKFDLQVNKAPEERLDDIKTHTGQVWDSDDYRLARFITVPKLVNQRSAMDLIHEVPAIPVQGSLTFCDGGGAMGHPKVYINVDKPGNHSCGYCGLRFFKDDHHH